MTFLFSFLRCRSFSRRTSFTPLPRRDRLTAADRQPPGVRAHLLHRQWRGGRLVPASHPDQRVDLQVLNENLQPSQFGADELELAIERGPNPGRRGSGALARGACPEPRRRRGLVYVSRARLIRPRQTPPRRTHRGRPFRPRRPLRLSIPTRARRWRRRHSRWPSPRPPRIPRTPKARRSTAVDRRSSSCSRPCRTPRSGPASRPRLPRTSRTRGRGPRTTPPRHPRRECSSRGASPRGRTRAARPCDRVSTTTSRDLPRGAHRDRAPSARRPRPSDPRAVARPAARAIERATIARGAVASCAAIRRRVDRLAATARHRSWGEVSSGRRISAPGRNRVFSPSVARSEPGPRDDRSRRGRGARDHAARAVEVEYCSLCGCPRVLRERGVQARQAGEGDGGRLRL